MLMHFFAYFVLFVFVSFVVVLLFLFLLLLLFLLLFFVVVFCCCFLSCSCPSKLHRFEKLCHESCQTPPITHLLSIPLTDGTTRTA